MMKHFSQFLQRSGISLPARKETNGARKKFAKKATPAKKRRYGKDSFDFLDLINHWNLVVGDMLAKNTVPLKIQRGSLIILTKHSAFSNELSFMEKPLIKKIVNEYPPLKGKFKRIFFQTSSNYFDNNNKEEKPQTINDYIDTQKSVDHKHSPFHKEKLNKADKDFNFLEDDNEMKDLLISLRMQVSDDE